MSNYPLEELISRWKKEELTAEQVIGQLLLIVHGHEQRLRALGRQPADRNDTTAKERRQR